MDATTFLEALDDAVAVVTAPEVAAAWDEPSALEGYTVGGLVAHLLLATARTADALAAPPPSDDGAPPLTVAGLYGRARIDDRAALATGVAARLVAAGNDKAGEGAAEVVAAFAALPSVLRPLLAADDATPDRLVEATQAGDLIRLDDHLATRILELVVHADDLAVSVGRPTPEPSPAVVRALTGVLVDLAVARSGATAVVRAFTRAERSDPDVLRVL